VKRVTAALVFVLGLSISGLTSAQTPPASGAAQPPQQQQKPDEQKPDKQKQDKDKQDKDKQDKEKQDTNAGEQAKPEQKPQPPPPPPPPPHNLQVFPKDTPRPEVVAHMQAIAQALGVQCGYCHVEDRASDEKPTKNTARVMMRMTADINQKLGTEITTKPAAELTRVGCVTCHRGVAIPKQLSEVLLDTEGQKGVKAAIDQYWDLRKRYFGRQSYDFGEMSLVEVAQKIVQEKPDDALALLETNTTFFPQSGRTYFVMAQAYNAKKDKAKAIENLERAVVLEPQNQQAKRLLEQLRGTTQQ